MEITASEEKTSDISLKKRKVKAPLEIILRVVIVATLICMFIPGLNPARMSALIDGNASLFTTSISYNSLTEGFTRAIRKGWVTQSVINLTYLDALITCIGVAAAGVGCAMTLGEVKLKKLGSRFSIAGCVGGFIGILIMILQYSEYAGSSKPEKVAAEIPTGMYVFIAMLFICLALGVIYRVTLPKVTKLDKYEMESKYRLFLMMLPFILLLFLFSYLPLWGWRYAFYDYTPGSELTSDKFVGMKWFSHLFENEATRSDIIRVLKNTIAMSGLGILTSWIRRLFGQRRNVSALFEIL